jgi:hypothetical protein
MRIAGAGLALVLAILGLGCTGVQTLGHGDHASAYGPSFVSYAARSGQVPLVVRGDPFGLAPAETSRVLAERLSLPGWFANRPFLATPDNATSRRDYRVVLIANPARPLLREEPCGDLSQVPVAGQGQTLTMHATFCAPDGWLASVRGQMPAALPGNPALQGFLDQLMATLLPPRNPHHDPDGEGEIRPAG